MMLIMCYSSYSTCRGVYSRREPACWKGYIYLWVGIILRKFLRVKYLSIPLLGKPPKWVIDILSIRQLGALGLLHLGF